MAKKKRTEDEKREILKEARGRFRRASAWEASFRTKFRKDVMFAEADAYNMWQWEQQAQDMRAGRPMLTINRVRQHNLDILNDARQSRVAIKVRPLRGGASYDSAMMLDGIIRHIEYISNAESAYQMSLKYAVQGGIGYIRLVTDYAGDDSFDQEIYIRQIKDPLSILLDPDITEFDGSDALFGFVFTDMEREEFEKAYPKLKDTATDSELAPDESWGAGEKVKIAEYFRCVREEGKLVSFEDPVNPGETITKTEKEVDDELLKSVIDTPSYAERLVVLTTVEHFKIVGDTIAEENIWPGRYVPLIRCVGEETIIDGQMDRKGHTRALLDSQRMFNYNAPLSLDTPIPTPTGWTTMGAVQAGDWLLSEMGRPVRVNGTSPTFLMRDCHRITFDDGSHIVADGEHKWTVEERGKRKASGTEWRKRTITTRELACGKHFIYATEPLALEDAELPIHPYVLGAWLGDGSSAKPVIHSGVEDVEQMRANLQACGYTVSEPRFYGDKTCAELAIFGLTSKLKALGVWNNKHIPAVYLRASRDQREALLQGLMDTDGNISKARQCSFTSTIEALASDFAELLRTFGLKATRRTVAGQAAMFPNGQTYTRQDADRFHFTASPEVNVFRLSRKAAPQQAERPLHPRRTRRHRIVSIEAVPWVPTKCVGVDSESHLFLAGEGMVPTHNSAAVEYGALQSKVPWKAPAKAIEGYEEIWNAANISNPSVLPWNHLDEDGKEIPAPAREQPPMAAPVFMQGMRDAIEQMYLASGQNQADFGQPGNEKSGVAIQQRQRQGDNATYHYLDHQAAMIRLAGKQLLDLIGKVYDTARMVKYRDDAGNETDIRVDPEAKVPYQKTKTPEGEEVVILNPKLGVYDVQADVGPAYATRRQEAFNAFSQLLSSNKELVSVVGDIWMRFADIPGAQEAAERLKRMIPKQALEDGPSPDLLAAQAQIAELTKLVETVSAKLESKDGEAKDAEEKNAIAGYKAVTDRVKALEKALALDPGGLMVLVKEVIEEAQAQSAGGNALEHAMDDDPARADIHADLGGQLQGPEPHTPPVDPNKVPSPTVAPAETV